MAMETQDIIKRSATNPITPAPRARDFKAEVAKLIDVLGFHRHVFAPYAFSMLTRNALYSGVCELESPTFGVRVLAM